MGRKVIIIGAGQAASACALRLRALDAGAQIALLGEERELPYQRPPLSKGFVKGEVGLEGLTLRTQAAYSEARIDLYLDARVKLVDTEQNCVTTTSGIRHGFDVLVFATGSRPRPLPDAVGGSLPSVLMLRSIRDAQAIQKAASVAQSVVIVGGGYIGLEAAAVFARMGIKVTLVEAAERVLQRVASPRTSDYFRALHRAEGVDIREGVPLQALKPGSDGCFATAVLDDGTEISADFALVGIGGIANDQLAAAAGLDVKNGIVVDSAGRSSVPGIYACGDCANFELDGQNVRLESVQNAIDQAEIVARSIANEDVAYAPVPWFWSDQYDTKLQIAGLSTGHTDYIVRPGKREGSMAIWYYSDARLIAVDAMNDPQSYMLGRRALKAGHSPDPSQLANIDLPLKQAVGL